MQACPVASVRPQYEYPPQVMRPPSYVHFPRLTVVTPAGSTLYFRRGVFWKEFYLRTN